MIRPHAPAARPSPLLPSLLLLALAHVALPACVTTAPRSDARNPLGWPGHGVEALGHAAADSELPLIQETGRLLASLGGLLDAPALLVEGIATLSVDDLVGGLEMLVVGAGETVTSAVNVPLFVFVGRHVDLGREAAGIELALAYAASNGTPLVPAGTTVRASGRNLVWDVPGRGEVLQRAEGSLPFRAMLLLSPAPYVAMERSWGFVVPDVDAWDARPARARVETTIHEFWHQLHQMRDDFLGWTVLYWPAYSTTFLFTGWNGHWAETGPDGAANVDRALREWNGPTGLSTL